MIDTFLDTDLPHVASLLRGLNALHVQRVPHRFHDDADPETLEAFLATLMEQGGRILVYRAEGVPRGYLLWKLRDIPASAVERGRRVAVLEHIAVAPSWRRRGIPVAGDLVSTWDLLFFIPFMQGIRCDMHAARKGLQGAEIGSFILYFFIQAISSFSIFLIL